MPPFNTAPPVARPEDALSRPLTPQATLQSVHVLVNNPEHRDAQLNEAVEQLIPAALKRRDGILITRNAPGSYLVEIETSVPCGSTYQRIAP